MSQSHLFRLLKQRWYWLLNPRNTILPTLIVGASTMISAQVATIPAGVPLRVEIDHPIR
jgi:hypothetical protein